MGPAASGVERDRVQLEVPPALCSPSEGLSRSLGEGCLLAAPGRGVICSVTVENPERGK